MNVSLILTLIVEATLSLVQQAFIDSVNFIVQTCNFKNKQICHYSLKKETVKLHQLWTSLEVNLEVCLKEFWKCVLLNYAPTSTQFYPPPPSSTQFHSPLPSSFQPSPSSLQHSQQYSNQNIARNWAISQNLGRNIQSFPFWLKVSSHGILKVLIPNPDLHFWNFNPKILFWENLGPKSQSCLFCLKIGTHGISRMVIRISTSVFWISNQKPIFGQIFGQIWVKKVKFVHFAWKLAHMVSRGCGFLFRN